MTHTEPADTSHSAPREDRKMFAYTKVKLEKSIVERIRKYAEIAGYSSPEEFITHALEKELAHLEDAEDEEEIKKRLKGLGYMS